MTRVRLTLAVGASVALTAGLAVTATAAPDSAEAATSVATTTRVAETAPSRARTKPFNPVTGVKFNDPRGKVHPRYAGYNQVLKSIQSSRYPSRIDIATWNFDSGRLTNALVEAHKRGVRVRLLMQDNMALHQSRVSGSFWRLRAGLEQPRYRPKREDAGNSWARMCRSSCRGNGGILHSKFYLFSKVSSTPNVVVISSGNLTEYAASLQWNDTYTVAGHAAVYRTWVALFKEMAQDRRARPPYREIKHDARFTSIFLPYKGWSADGDPVLRRLRGVKCTGALSGSGDARGVTKIRIAQTAWMEDRGEAIAKRVKALHGAGCNVKVIYAVMPVRIRNVLNAPGPRGAVPTRQLTQDVDDDGFYDRYLHMKVLTVDGVKGKNRAAHLVWNGSENWNTVSLNSDEAGFEIAGVGLTHTYNSWIDYLFAHAPKNPGVPPEPPEEDEDELERRRTLGTMGADLYDEANDPYKYVEIY